MFDFYLTTKELDDIAKNSKKQNIYYALYFLNKYAENKILDEVKRLDNKNISTLIIKDLSIKMMRNYVVHIKKQIYTSICFEYNVLVDNNEQIDSFSNFIENYTNNEEWIKYYLNKYPVLKNNILNTIVNSVDFIRQFMLDLDTDYVSLKKKYNINISNLMDIEVLSGDSHNSMRTVTKLIFSNVSIFYKPRPLINEEFIYDFFNFLNNNGLKKSMKYPKTLSYKNRGWMEEVKHNDVKNENELKEFYLHQGINLSVFYFLGVTDLIADNIIADGKYPCYFDLECILQPFYKGINDDNFYETNCLSSKFIKTSVLASNLLPQDSFFTEEFQGITISGLSLIDSDLPIHKMEFDESKFNRVYKKVKFDSTNNHLPSLNGLKKNPTYKINEILQGFIQGYDFVSKNKECILKYLSQNEINLNVRFIYRATNIYSKLLSESFLPKYLNSVKKTTELWNSLYNAENILFKNKKVIKAEIDQLSNLDIPLFYSNTNSLSILGANNILLSNNFFDTSGYDLCIEKIKNSSLKDMQKQIDLIKLSFAIHEGSPFTSNFIKGGSFNFSKYSGTNKPPEIKKLIKHQINNIVNKLEEKAFIKNKEFSYFDLIQTPRSSWSISSIDWGLFDGLDGIAFFYLNCFLVFDDNISLNKGKDILNKGLSQFSLFKEYYKQKTGFNKISLMNYPISTFYIAELYMHKGVEIEMLDDEKIDEILEWINFYYKTDLDFDLMGGGAGTIVYLLALYERMKKNEILKTACLVADRIIEKANKEKNIYYWVSTHYKSHTGFSHGSSGFAYILSKLCSIKAIDLNKKQKYLEVFRGALNYEDQMFDKKGKYWYFYKNIKTNKIDKTENHFWAYGSGAIAQSRMLIYKYLNEDKIIDDINISINNLKINAAKENFNYSSGVFGNLDILNMYSNMFDDKELHLNLLVYLNNLFNKLEENKEDFDWACAPLGYDRSSYFEMNGLFTGISGIGNVLLNIYDYDKTCKLFY